VSVTEIAAFKVDGGAPVDLDAHIAQLPWLRLVRSDTGLRVECALGDAERAVALLARGGARCVRVQGIASASTDLVPAIMSDLAPVTLPGAIDSVTVRTLDLGEATAKLMRGSRSILRRKRDDRALRGVLRADDRVIAWRRVLWARPSVLRSQRVRGARPVVFDRGALEHATERFTLTRADQIGRWARG
jgi:hypothetical protein